MTDRKHSMTPSDAVAAVIKQRRGQAGAPPRLPDGTVDQARLRAEAAARWPGPGRPAQHEEREETRTCSVRLPRELWQQLDKAAQEAGLKRNTLIAVILQKAVADASR